MQAICIPGRAGLANQLQYPPCQLKKKKKIALDTLFPQTWHAKCPKKTHKKRKKELRKAIGPLLFFS